MNFYTLKLAFKNLIKVKRRTILTFTMLTFGTTLYIWMDAMYEGFDRASFKNYIDFETSHFKIHDKSYDPDHPLDQDHFMRNTSGLLKELRSLPFVTAATERVEFLSEVDNSIDATPVVTVGVDLKTDPRVFSLRDYIFEGKLEKGGAVMGAGLAEDFGLRVGDFINNVFRDRNGMVVSREFIITGLVRTGDPKINESSLFIDIELARELLDMQPGEGASGVAVRTTDFKKTSSYGNILRDKFSDRYQIKSWQEMSGEFAALMKTKRSVSGVLLFFIILIALVGIINTLLMSVFEKKREIGTLMALGMTKKEVRNIFLWEGVLIGSLGTFSGLFLGTLLNLYFIYVGVDWMAMFGDMDFGFNVLGKIKSAWVPMAYLNSTVLVILASLLSSYYPAKKIMKMEPVECLRTNQ